MVTKPLVERRSGGIGLLLPGEPEIPRMVELARRAETLGYESIWLAETRFTRDAIVAASAVAAATTMVRVGTAVVNPFTRASVLTAITFASLDELARGRVVAGIGCGSPAVLAKQGIAWTEPLAKLRAMVETMRALLAGDAHSAGARLDFAPTRPRVPIYFGVTGPRALELAGELADGVILNGLLPIGYVPHAVARINAGAQRAGRNPAEIEIAGVLTTSVDRDGATARDALRPSIADYLAGFPHLARETGLSDDEIGAIARARKRSLAEAASLVSDEIVSALACAGTPDECRAAIRARHAAGIQLPLISVAAGNLDLAVESLAPGLVNA